MKFGIINMAGSILKDARTEQVQSRHQEVSKQRIGNFKRETKIKTRTKGQGRKCQKNTKISIVTNLSP
jgi:hypothetical protein